MNKLLLCFTFFYFGSLNLSAQNSCNYKFSVPDELARGRYQEPDMREGHPYSLFNKNTPGWTLEGALEEIRVKDTLVHFNLFKFLISS